MVLSFRRTVIDVHLFAHHIAKGFLSAARPMLYGRETVNNLILGVSERLFNEPTAYENPFFATVSGDDGEVILAAVMTPPHNLILAGEERAESGFPILIDHLLKNHIPVPGVIAPGEIAERFSQHWEQMTGNAVAVSMRQRVYELRQVRMPDFPPGAFRLASPAEIPIIAEWIQAFEAEALEKSTELDVARADRLVARGMMYVWSLGREIVSMAMKTRPIAHSITIGEVYTPPEHRRRGYAGILVACLSQHLLDEGYQFVNLFTDLDNPTSNKIYKEVGYQPVCDFRMYRFTGSPE
jgi:uncharacterized protein